LFALRRGGRASATIVNIIEFYSLKHFVH